MAGGCAVLIANIAAHDCAEPLDIEIRVLDFERIEGPLDELDTARESVFALLELEANALIAILRRDAEHVTVQIGFAPCLETGNGEAEADHAAAIVRTESLAADFSGDDEEANGQ